MREKSNLVGKKLNLVSKTKFPLSILDCTLCTVDQPFHIWSHLLPVKFPEGIKLRYRDV